MATTKIVSHPFTSVVSLTLMIKGRARPAYTPLTKKPPQRTGEAKSVGMLQNDATPSIQATQASHADPRHARGVGCWRTTAERKRPPGLV
jgi:hypothetical protein